MFLFFLKKFNTGANSIAASIAEPSSLRSRAQALVNAGAAANVRGAEAILKTTIELIVKKRCAPSSHHQLIILAQANCFVAVPIAEVIAESYPTSLNAPFWPLMPLSRGHIHIASADPFAPPKITPRFLTDVFDQQVGVAAARRLRDVFTNKAFDGIVADAYQYPPLGPNATDAEYLTWLQGAVNGASHWIGATAMLPRELGGVVDSRLRYVLSAPQEAGTGGLLTRLKNKCVRNKKSAHCRRRHLTVSTDIAYHVYIIRRCTTSSTDYSSRCLGSMPQTQ